MRSSNRPAIGLAGVLALVLASFAGAQDWPQWRGPNRDGKVSGFTAPAAWPKTLAEKWKIEVGAADSTPALVGDRVYVFARQGGDEVILCVNAADGKEIWRDKYAAVAVTGAASRGHTGPRSSPTVADGKVLTLGVGGVVSCLDAASGKVIWRNSDFKGVPRFFTSTSPIVVDGMAIAQLGAQGSGTTAAFDLGSGDIKWKWTEEGPGYASPVVATIEGVKQIVTLSEKSAVGLATADGKLLWKVAFAPQGMAYNAATPIVDGSTVYVTGQGRGTKALKVEKAGDAFKATELWSNPAAVQFNTPVLKDGFLYGITDRGDIFCINAQDGKTAWTQAAGMRQFGCIVDAGSVLVALPQAGELTVFKANPKAYEEVAKIKVGAQTYAHPVLAGNRIFVKDQQSLALLAIE